MLAAMGYAEIVSAMVADLAGPGEPGLAVGVYEQGDLVFTASAGEACVEFGVPVDARTRFDIASASKQFTAAAALLLARDGKLDLDEGIHVHLPELSLPVPVTVRQCLQHTAGLPEWYSLVTVAGIPLYACSEERLVELFTGLRTLNYQPGTAFSYSNTGYVLTAAVIRRITGQSLNEFATERIFRPLGMNDTLFRDDVTAVLPRFAPGYNSDKGLVRADTVESAVGDGGLVTSVSDLAPWFGFLADGRVLGADLRDQLVENTAFKYSFGIYPIRIGELDGFGHAGGVPGYRSQLIYVPSAGIGVSLLSNQSRHDPVAIAAKVARIVTGQPQPVVDATPGDAEALAGHWFNEITDAAVEIELSDGGIRFQGEEFTHRADGVWRDESATELWLADGRLMMGTELIPARQITMVRREPATGARLPEGSFRNAEIGATLTIADGRLVTTGQPSLPLTPVSADAWQAGPLVTLYLEGGDLLLSSHGVRRMRFTPQEK